jgi:hypothetical protein
MSIIILDYKLDLESSVVPERTSSLYCKFIHGNISIDKNKMFPMVRFEEDMVSLIHKLNEMCNCIYGIILVLEIQECTAHEGFYKIDSDGINFNECKFKYSVVNSNPLPAKRKLTTDDKIALFKEFCAEMERIPSDNEIFKNFHIGKWFSSLEETGNLFKLLTSMLDINQDVDE